MRVYAVLLMSMFLLAGCGSEEEKLPTSEASLCKLLTESLTEYVTLANKIQSNPSNGLLFTQVAQEQTQVYFRRDRKLRQYFSENANFNDWILQVEQVGGFVSLVGSVPCSTPIKVKANVVNSGNNIGFLSERRPGERVRANGRINYRPVEMAFNHGETDYAMRNPTYDAVIQSVQEERKN